MEKKLYKVFYKTVSGMEGHTYIEADGEEKNKICFMLCSRYADGINRI